jgi:hypothetical protein
LIEKDIAVVERIGNGDKSPATTGAGDAFTGINDKKCAVVGAHDHAVTAIEKLVRFPFEWNVQMGAAILVKINLVSLAYCKELLSGQFKSFAATLRDILQGAEKASVIFRLINGHSGFATAWGVPDGHCE